MITLCQRCGLSSERVDIGTDGICRDCADPLSFSPAAGPYTYKRLQALRKIIDAEDSARDERSAIWRILSDAGVTQGQIAQASPGVDEDAVQKALKRYQPPEDDPWAHLASLSATLLYSRLLRVSKRIAKAKEAREERAELWRQGIEAGLSNTSLAAASGVHKSFVKMDLDRRAKVTV